MSELIKIMLVEDDPMVCESFRIAVRTHPNLAIIYETGSEQEALGFFQTHEVDVIILDIELREGDGVSFLDALGEQKKEKPFVAVVTNTGSSVMLGYIREHGADYLYQKNNISYAPSKVLCIIEKICPYQKMVKERQTRQANELFKEEKDEDIKRQYVEDELQKMGFKKKQVGFAYIVDAVMILMDYSGVPPRLTSEIYPLIAERRNASWESVERSIRNAIEVTFREMNPAQLNRYYPYAYDKQKGRPSNGDFLTKFAQLIRL